MLVVEQSLVRLPGLSAIARLEQRRRLDAAIEDVRLGSPSPARSARSARAPDPTPPGSSRSAVRARSRSRRCRRWSGASAPSACCWSRRTCAASPARVVKERVHSLAAEMGSLDLPFPSGFVGAQNERALHGADEEECLLFSGRKRRVVFGFALARVFFAAGALPRSASLPPPPRHGRYAKCSQAKSDGSLSIGRRRGRRPRLRSPSSTARHRRRRPRFGVVVQRHPQIGPSHPRPARHQAAVDIAVLPLHPDRDALASALTRACAHSCVTS